MIGDGQCTAPTEINVTGGKRSVTIAGPGVIMPRRDGTGGICPMDGGQRSIILIEPATDRGPHTGSTGVTTLSCRDGADAARITGDGPHIGAPGRRIGSDPSVGGNSEANRILNDQPRTLGERLYIFDYSARSSLMIACSHGVSRGQPRIWLSRSHGGNSLRFSRCDSSS